MRRRRFLGFTSVAACALAGCNSRDSADDDRTPTPSASPDDDRTPTPSTSTSTKPSPTDSSTDSPTDTVGESPRTIFVAPDGDTSNPGTTDAPLDQIQAAIDRAYGGDTIQVRPGTYNESLATVRPGSSDQPITLTGPADAVITSARQPLVKIRHAHFHLRGLTIDGLHNPQTPESPSSYVNHLIHCIPPHATDEYVEGVVIAPAGLGNSRRAMILVNRSKNLEIGPLKVVGLGGAGYNAADATGEGHVGEIVYLGTPPEIALHEEPRPYYPWKGLDQSRDVHIHHIDNSAGHPHAEMVNTKLGTRDVLVEYCTSLGGSNNTEPYETAEVRFQSHRATLRWCNLRNGQGHGVHIVSHENILEAHPEAAMSTDQSGVGHSIYGNVLWNFGAKTIAMRRGADAQDVLCGNTFTGVAEGNLLSSCGPNVPKGDGIGHTHATQADLPTLRRLGLRFAISKQPSSEDDRQLAFFCRRFALADSAGEPTLTVDVGGREQNIAYTGGVFGRFDDGTETWRWFGGDTGTVGLYVPVATLDRAQTLELEGKTPWSGNSVSLYMDDTQISKAELSEGDVRTYTLPLTTG